MKHLSSIQRQSTQLLKDRHRSGCSPRSALSPSPTDRTPTHLHNQAYSLAHANGRKMPTSIKNNCYLDLHNQHWQSVRHTGPNKEHELPHWTCAEVAVLQSTKTDCHLISATTLRAANDTSLKEYGQRSFTLNLVLRSSLSWVFTKAELPFAAEHSQSLHGTIDLVSAYLQTKVDPNGILKATIITLSDLFKFVQNQFGLHNVAQIFQRFIHEAPIK